MWCNFKISPLHGTWFSQSHLDLQTICRFIGYFLMIRPSRQTFLKEELQISSKTAIDWANFCREVHFINLLCIENIIYMKM